jgi:hypothetical protein
MIVAFAKICTCTAIVIGAPLIAASAVDLYTKEISRDLEYRACLRTEELNNAGVECMR